MTPRHLKIFGTPYLEGLPCSQTILHAPSSLSLRSPISPWRATTRFSYVAAIIVVPRQRPALLPQATPLISQTTCQHQSLPCQTTSSTTARTADQFMAQTANFITSPGNATQNTKRTAIGDSPRTVMTNAHTCVDSVIQKKFCKHKTLAMASMTTSFCSGYQATWTMITRPR